MSALPVSIPFGDAVYLTGWLEELAPIGLARLNEHAALQTRVDRKYLVDVAVVADLLSVVTSRVKVLEIDGLCSFGYESVYFDTPDLAAYRSAAHRRRRRFKVRTRAYLDSGLCWVEVKTKGPRKSTIKNRRPHPFGDRLVLGPGRQFVDTTLTSESIPGTEALTLTPSLITRYRRSTLYLPENSSRVTIDTDLTWSDGARGRQLPDTAVIETKAGSGATLVDRLLWAQGHRPCRISKYCVGLASLRPDLPSARWRRTLNRYVLDAG
ncbi:MAG: hypothetical protein QG622_462 [Actinomycetota bacterium]|nr:hypothetical protein [Actinomycetota bacterium]